MTAEPAFQYIFPLESEDESMTPIYKPRVQGQLYLYHYGAEKLYIIQDKPAPKLHDDRFAVEVIVLNKEKVEEANQTGELIQKYTDTEITDSPQGSTEEFRYS